MHSTVRSSAPVQRAAGCGQGKWTEDEHARFLDALRWFPSGPWKAIANHVGTRSIRQVQTHTQKYVEKTRRRARGLLKIRRGGPSSTDHAVDEQVTALCMGIRRRKPTQRGHRRSRPMVASATVPASPMSEMGSTTTSSDESDDSALTIVEEFLASENGTPVIDAFLDSVDLEGLGSFEDMLSWMPMAFDAECKMEAIV